MVRRLNEDMIKQIRQGVPFTDPRGYNTEDQIVKPEYITITKESAACRHCSCPLDIGVRAIICNLWIGHPPVNVRAKPPKIYLHEENCFTEGFIQTNGFRNKAPQHFVVVRDGKQCEGRIDPRPTITMGPNGQCLSYPIVYVSGSLPTWESPKKKEISNDERRKRKQRDSDQRHSGDKGYRYPRSFREDES